MVPALYSNDRDGFFGVEPESLAGRAHNLAIRTGARQSGKGIAGSFVELEAIRGELVPVCRNLSHAVGECRAVRLTPTA